MWIDFIRYEPHTLSLRHFKFFFSSFISWFLQPQSCFIKWYEKEQSVSFDRFTSIMAIVLGLWIYFMKVVAKCKYFVMSYIRQNKKRKRTGIHRAICYCGMWAFLSTKLKGKSSSLTTEKHACSSIETNAEESLAERKDEESWRCVNALTEYRNNAYYKILHSLQNITQQRTNCRKIYIS